MGTIHGLTDVQLPLEWKGPSGGISNRWIWRADQSFSRVNPKMWS
jgi:hypothetical protein